MRQSSTLAMLKLLEAGEDHTGHQFEALKALEEGRPFEVCGGSGRATPLEMAQCIERLALGGRVPKTAGSMAIVQSQPRLLDAALALGQGSAEIYSYSVTARHGDSRHIRASCKS